MSDERWVLDATLDFFDDGLYCFCPIEGDLDGEYSIVFGMNIINDKPPGKLVAIIHEDGQEALDNWCERHAEVLARWKAAQGAEQEG